MGMDDGLKIKYGVKNAAGSPVTKDDFRAGGSNGKVTKPAHGIYRPELAAAPGGPGSSPPCLISMAVR
jgi:hypothetical protein